MMIAPPGAILALEGRPLRQVGTTHTSQLQLEKRRNLATWLFIIIII